MAPGEPGRCLILFGINEFERGGTHACRSESDDGCELLVALKRIRLQRSHLHLRTRRDGAVGAAAAVLDRHVGAGVTKARALMPKDRAHDIHDEEQERHAIEHAREDIGHGVEDEIIAEL